MPPKITRVRWSAQNLPYGLDISGTTSVITGTPEDVGEYTVPVTVETNYGKDTKDVTIVVEPPTYTAYVVGDLAVNWAGRNTQPDTDGLMALPISKVEKLSEWAAGLRAYTPMSGKTIYGAGVVGLKKNVGNYWTYQGEGNFLQTCGNYSLTSDIECYRLMYDAGLTADSTYTIATITADNKLTIKNSLRSPVYQRVTDSYGTHYQLYDTKFTSIGGVSSIPILGLATKLSTGVNIGWQWLLEDGTQYTTMTLRITKGSTYTTTATGTTNLTTTDIGYKATKIFSSKHFTFLSEDNYLDNNPDNFTYGVIKNAWGRSDISYSSPTAQDKFYVQTTNDEIYEYDAENDVWSLLGTYDVKKLMYIVGKKQLYVLTNEGKLYHRGTELKGKCVNPEQTSTIIEYDCILEHDTLTHIFPTRTFVDFTVSSGTINNNPATTLTLLEGEK